MELIAFVKLMFSVFIAMVIWRLIQLKLPVKPVQQALAFAFH